MVGTFVTEKNFDSNACNQVWTVNYVTTVD